MVKEQRCNTFFIICRIMEYLYKQLVRIHVLFVDQYIPWRHASYTCTDMSYYGWINHACIQVGHGHAKHFIHCMMSIVHGKANSKEVDRAHAYFMHLMHAWNSARRAEGRIGLGLHVATAQLPDNVGQSSTNTKNKLENAAFRPK